MKTINNQKLTKKLLAVVLSMMPLMQGCYVVDTIFDEDEKNVYNTFQFDPALFDQNLQAGLGRNGRATATSSLTTGRLSG